MIDYRGEVAALSAAFIWAVASVVYTRIGRQLPALILNFVKGLIAIALLALTLVVFGNLLPSVSPQALGLLILSGILGIGLGDTAYFEALNCLGPRRSLILEALAPPLAAILALIFLHENLPVQGWFGILLTICGVVWVVLERTSTLPDFKVRFARGTLCGIFAAIAQAGGAVLSRAALADATITPLWSTFVRLASGLVVLLVWILLRQKPLQGFKPLNSRRLWGVLAITAFASTYLGIWLQQLSLKYAPTGVAQALSATSPLFVIPIAVIVMKERIGSQAIIGAAIAISGVWLLFSR